MRARTPAAAIDALRSLGTLLTLATGILSAVWWHQSATLSGHPTRTAPAGSDRESEATVLNAAAATATGLALIGGVFSGLAWSSLEGSLAASTFLILLAMSGDELRNAAKLSVRQGLPPRSALAFLVLVAASLLFVFQRIVR